MRPTPQQLRGIVVLLALLLLWAAGRILRLPPVP